MLAAMKWTTAFVMCAALGCGGKKDEPKPEKEPEQEPAKPTGWGDRLSGIADKAKELGSEVGDKAKEVGDKAKELGSEVGDKAKEIGNDVETKAKQLEIEKQARALGDEVARRAEGLSQDALALGKDLKDKLAAARKLARYNYDLSIDATPEDEAEFAKRHAKLKQLDVAGYKVGFERRSQHPLGKVYKWQFVFGWRLPDGRTVRLSLFTDDELEELVLASMMGELLPLANLNFKK